MLNEQVGCGGAGRWKSPRSLYREVGLRALWNAKLILRWHLLPAAEIGLQMHPPQPQYAKLESAAGSLSQWVSAAGAASAGPVNSASIEKSIKSPTPIVVPGAGMPNVIPKSERLNEPCAENPMRACGSILGNPG